MDDRYDRSRYGSGGDKRSSADSYRDRFFENMRISGDEPEPQVDNSFSARLGGGRTAEPRRRRGDGSGPVAVPLEAGAAESSETAEPTEPKSRAARDAAVDGEGREASRAGRPRRDFSRKAVESELASGSRTPAKKRGLRRAGVVAGIVVAVVVLVGAGVALAYFSGISDNLHSGVDDDLRAALVQTDMANEPFYLLLLGTDGSVERDGDPDYGGSYRSDSMMLARIDPVEKKVTLVSIGRDILVDFGGEWGEEKINAAYAFGGPAMAVKAVSKLAGVPISHYAQVDFDGFAAMVDALGGVEVDVPMSFDDADAGGALEAGLQELDGDQALVLCRMRNAYADISAHPDAMRAANQRLVLSAIAKKLLASDVATIAATVQAMSAYVTTDLELGDIIGLAQIMRGLNPDSDIYTASVPTTSEYVDEGWYEFVNKDEWTAMAKRIDAGEPPVEEAVVDEATGVVLATSGAGASTSEQKQAAVTVKNATDKVGLASKVRSKLMDAGFANVVVGEITDSFEYPETLVVYDEPARAREAAEIVAAIGQGEAMENDGSYLLMDTDFIVVIGDDWTE